MEAQSLNAHQDGPCRPSQAPESPGPHASSSESTSQTQRASAPEQQVRTSTFPIFFYGTLQSPRLLASLLSLTSPPLLRRGTITGFAIKLWRSYPVLVPRENSKVVGMMWEVTAPQFQRLEEYEGTAYTYCECDVEIEDGKVVRGCRVFVARDPQSKMLREGKWDLEEFERLGRLGRRGRRGRRWRGVR